MKTIQCAHPPHHHNGFVATCRLWTASGGVIYIYIYIMVENRIRGGICHAIHRYAKANNNYMRNYDKNKESLHLLY